MKWIETGGGACYNIKNIEKIFLTGVRSELQKYQIRMKTTNCGEVQIYYGSIKECYEFLKELENELEDVIFIKHISDLVCQKRLKNE